MEERRVREWPGHLKRFKYVFLNGTDTRAAYCIKKKRA